MFPATQHNSIYPKVISWITEVPEMELIPIDVCYDDVVFDGPISYSIDISYLEHGRNDVVPTILGKTPNPGPIHKCAWKVDSHGAFQGGNCVVKLEIPYKTPDGIHGVRHEVFDRSIRGKNPPPAAVRAYLGSVEMQVIAYKESRFRQFWDHGVDCDLPIHHVEPDGRVGFGIMQITTPRPTAREIWDWKANINAARKLLQQKMYQARTHYLRTRRKYNDHTIPQLSRSQLRLEVYRRYNGGAYWAWNPRKRRWVRRPGGQYADDCLRVERELFPNGVYSLGRLIP